MVSESLYFQILEDNNLKIENNLIGLVILGLGNKTL